MRVLQHTLPIKNDYRPEYAFEEGQSCLEKYKEMRDVYDRLCDRLGVTDEDEDVEKIIQSLMDIQEELCCRMYRYGAEFGI